ncbi:tyrosine-protein phosphatase non-receptor type 2a [Nerophis ophidion]|uniref:tyrosine-protein phosphatase non-receptor type 2a n=1 Tax=Nerophis ophidion TaxID=159077 RepID=UPI002AE0756A|nr:tyrosine-protein phosphatase non-receptor type 2a [Nerophis ophidion]
MEQQFQDIDCSGSWQNIYNEIRNQANEYSYKVAKLPANRLLNRYRDVSPYDHSRVKLENSENDYINASLVTVKEVQRAYILSQGPLRNTCGHFWLMIWEQCSKAVIMLNRIIEKGSEKCAQYWPTTEEQQMSFTDTGFVVRLLSEEDQSYFTIRVLELQNTKTGERREIYHFHYTAWPDFGVPESPASFLNFLFKVRNSGSLGAKHGPSVVHCSAGIGRSGTFALVDTCLVLMDRRNNPSSVDIQQVLLDMRDYRMGLIQTPDQLRFSYMAVIEGAKVPGSNNSVEIKNSNDLEKDLPPPPPPPRPHVNNRLDSKVQHVLQGDIKDHNQADPNGQLRKRQREARLAHTSQMVQEMKQRLNKSEQDRGKKLSWTSMLLTGGGAAVLALGLLVCWMFSQ